MFILIDTKPHFFHFVNFFSTENLKYFMKSKKNACKNFSFILNIISLTAFVL